MVAARPAQVFPPGEFLRDELEARGWSQTEFAEILGRPVGLVNDIIAGRRSITAETALLLGEAFDVAPEFWMNLEAMYQLSRLKRRDNNAVARRAALYAKAPVKEMVKRGWIKPSDDIAVLEEKICRFFRIETLDDEPRLPLYAAKQSTPYDEPPTPHQLAWLYRAQQLAFGVQAGSFSQSGVDDAVAQLRPLMHIPQESRHVPRILSDAGIKFVVVQPIPGSKIDGACLQADDGPVIAMSLRFDRLDNFWYVLMHELGHLSSGTAFVDSELDKRRDPATKPVAERLADEFAEERLVPQARLESFIARVRPLYSTRRIEAFSQTVKVHPAIVIGQLQHRDEIGFSSFRGMLVPIREWVTPAALTDGWGSELPADL